MKNLCSIIALFLLSSPSLLATDYYLSNVGNDANNGTSAATPWRTLTKLSAALGGTSGTWGTISTGDRIFFRKGDVFRGSIAFSAYNNDGITFDSYGSGALPVIKGSTVVTTWTVHSGSIWKATLAQRPYFLYDNSTLKTLARAPNTGTWNLSAATATSLTSAAVGSSGKNFVGANVCVREYDWRLNRQVVTAQSSNTVNWATSMAAAAADANFYFDNKLSLLDTEGEWFWEASNNTLYYMSATNPNTLTMEASTNLLGVAGNDNRSNNVFQNLQFEHFAQEGIRLMGSANGNTIQNCTFNNNCQAIFVSGSSATIQNNTIFNVYYQGAVLANMANGVFSNNTITNVGLNFGQHRPDFTGDFYSGGVWLINGNAGCVIGNNSISNIGNNGIRFGGVGITIERNQVTNAMVNMDDGGGIYTWGGSNSSHDNIIRNNIVDNLVGSHNGTAVGNIINAIYIDNQAYNITVENNTAKNLPSGSAIIVNAQAYNCTITGNVTYKCKQGLGFYDWSAGQSIYGNAVTGNTFYANVSGGIPLEIASNDNNHNVMSSANNNFLCNPYAAAVARYLWTNAQTFTLAQWRTATGLDAASVGTYYTWTSPTDNSFLVTNNSASPIIYDFNTNVKNLNNQAVTSLTLPPFTSRVLINTTALPVELLNFSGYTEGSSNRLNWTTASEKNNAGFDIESSADGVNFNKIGFAKGNGTTNSKQMYDFLDSAPPSGAGGYYRLQQTDFDGTKKASRTISIQKSVLSKGLKVYPNPTAQGEISVELGCRDKACLVSSTADDILVVNAVGQIVFQQKVEIRHALSPLRIDISSWSSGVYFIKSGQEVVKFVKN